MWGSNKPQQQHLHSQQILTPDSIQMAIKYKCFASREKVLMRGMQATCLVPSTNMAEICQDKKVCTHIQNHALWSESFQPAVLEWVNHSFCLWHCPALGLLPHQQADPLPLSSSLFFLLYLREKKCLTSSTNTACHWESNDSAVSSKTWPQTMTNGWSGALVMRSYGWSLIHCDTFVLWAFAIQVAAMMDWILKRVCRCISEKALIW